jgi:hypothetical protein
MGLIYVAQYILNEEYACPDCHEFPPDLDLMQPDEPFDKLFESFALIRERWGAPINITSGYRCPRYNNFIGGTALSAHQFGLALDIKVEPHNIEQLYKVVKEVAPELRIGKYSYHLHIDVAYEIYPRASETWKKNYRWTGTYSRALQDPIN